MFKDFYGKKFFGDAPLNNLDFALIIIGFFLGTTLVGIFNNFPDQQSNALVYIILLLTWGFISAFEFYSSKGDNFLDILAVGYKKMFWKVFVVGLFFGVLLLFTGSFFGSIVGVPFSLIAQTNLLLSFLFIVIVAPFVEANFFRGTVMSLIASAPKYFGLTTKKNSFGLPSVIFQAIIFAWFHWFVLGGNPNALLFTFFFGLIMGFGTYYFKSLAFEYSAHGLNNLVYWFLVVLPLTGVF